MPDLPELDQRLNSFNPELRAAALDAAAAKLSSPNPEGYQEPPPPRGEGSQVFNLHCHSFFSYNGYGYSPSALAVIAGMYNWRAVGLVDFDVLDGVDEFLAATRKLNIRAVAGMETRVFIPELADVEINSPGEPGIAYHLGVGFLSTAVPEKERAFAAELRKKAADRTRTVVKRLPVEFQDSRPSCAAEIPRIGGIAVPGVDVVGAEDIMKGTCFLPVGTDFLSVRSGFPPVRTGVCRLRPRAVPVRRPSALHPSPGIGCRIRRRPRRRSAGASCGWNRRASKRPCSSSA